MQPATDAVLLNRLIDAHRNRRRIVFLVGAGLSLPPAAGAPGVPGAGEMVRRVIDRLKESGAELPGNSDSIGYQEALELYRHHRGQRGLDALVREAVLEARVLLIQPVPGFPDIYPPGGVERLLAETACHPYLLQLTAYNLTRRLNDAGRLKATDDDVTAALDQALEENNLFQYLWDDLTATEQRLVAALARGEEPVAAGEAAEMLSQARRKLAGEQLIQRSGDGEGWRVAVPLFARWIREIGAAR